MHRAISVLVVLWSSLAVAEPAGAQAEALFHQGRDLVDAGKIAEGCSALEESQKLEPSVSTLLNLAACREKLGQLATAWGLFLDAERETRGSDATSQQFHDFAEMRARKLAPRVAHLSINVPQQSRVEGLEIIRDTVRVEPGLWNRALPIDGGVHTISARAPGASPWSTQVTVAAENEVKTVEIPDLRNLPRDVDKPAQPVAVATDAKMAIDPNSTPRASRVAPLLVGGGSLLLLGGSLAVERWAVSKYDDAKAEMMSESRRESLKSSADTTRYVAEGLAVTGLAAGATAIWLYLRAPDRERDGASNLSVVPTVGGLAVMSKF